MINTSRGMTWYTILKVLLIIWIIVEPTTFLSEWFDIAAQIGITFTELVTIFPLFFTSNCVNAFGDSILMAILFYHMRNKDKKSINSTRNILIFDIVISFITTLTTLIELQPFSGNDYSGYGENLGFVIARLIIFAPTYIYLKKRFLPVPRNPQSPYITHAEGIFPPFETVSATLEGIFNQADRDETIAQIMSGYNNPYTGQPIATEKDWDEYTRAYQAEQKQKLQKFTSASSGEQQTAQKETEKLKPVLAHSKPAPQPKRASVDLFAPVSPPVHQPVRSISAEQVPLAQEQQFALDKYNKRNRTDWEVGLDFERLIGYQYEIRGYMVKYIGATSGKEDMGRDLIVSNSVNTYIVQCKRWSRSSQIHEKYIFQLYGTTELYKKQHPGASVTGVFITTAYFSAQAKAAAANLGIEMIEHYTFHQHPLIKCKASAKRYYLPMDSEYDKISVNVAAGDYYCDTVAAAISAGFQSAYQ